MFDSEDVVFAWAFGKAFLIVIVSFGFLIYLAWAVTWRRENAALVGSPKDSALKYKSSVNAGEVLLIEKEQVKKRKGHAAFLSRATAQEIDVHEPSGSP